MCLLTALHGGAGTAEEATRRWRSSTSHGALLVAPESPYRATADEAERGRTWSSVDGAVDIVEAALSSVNVETDVPAIVGGFSQGGRIAARLAMSASPRPWRGAILFGPAPVDLPDVDATIGPLPRFWIFVGDEDRACYESTHRLAERLETVGVPVRLETGPGVDHDYPADMADRIDRALRFVLG